MEPVSVIHRHPALFQRNVNRPRMRMVRRHIKPAGTPHSFGFGPEVRRQCPRRLTARHRRVRRRMQIMPIQRIDPLQRRKLNRRKRRMIHLQIVEPNKLHARLDQLPLHSLRRRPPTAARSRATQSPPPPPPHSTPPDVAGTRRSSNASRRCSSPPATDSKHPAESTCPSVSETASASSSVHAHSRHTDGYPPYRTPSPPNHSNHFARGPG